MQKESTMFSQSIETSFNSATPVISNSIYLYTTFKVVIEIQTKALDSSIPGHLHQTCLSGRDRNEVNHDMLVEGILKNEIVLFEI